MSITLDAATEELLQRQLSEGRFANADDLVTHALRLVEAEALDLNARREALLRGLEEGIAQADRGEGITEEEMRARMSARRAAYAAKVA